MGWRETCAVDERMRFVLAVEAQEETMAALCRQFEVSRRTGYKWFGRYREAGVEGLVDRSRAPLHHPQAMTDELAERCLAVRRAHPTWGPVKVRAWLQRRAPKTRWPAASTIGALFDREGLTVKRRVRRRSPPSNVPFAQCGAANDVWCIDFKGWFLTGDGTHRQRSCLAGARCGLPRVRPSASAALRQWLALCLDRSRRTVEAVGQGHQGRGRAGAHCTGQTATERTIGAAASDVVAGHRQSAGAQPERATRALSCLPGPVQ